MATSSIPARVLYAVRKFLKPSIKRVMRLIRRRSFSTMLFRFLHWRIFTRRLCLSLNCFMPALFAPLLSILTKLGLAFLPTALLKKRSAALVPRLAVRRESMVSPFYKPPYSNNASGPLLSNRSRSFATDHQVVASFSESLF